MNADDHKSGSDNADLDLDKVEISDIPSSEEDDPVPQNGISGKMMKLGARLLMGAATFSLLLGLLFSNLSALKSSVLSFLPAPTPTPASGNNIILLNPVSNPNRIVGLDPQAQLTGRYVTGPTVAAPAPQTCAAAPTVTSSHEIGSSPVWLYGFDGPRATMHLRGLSQPIVHNVYGWPVFI